MSDSVHRSSIQLTPNTLDPISAIDTSSQLITINSFDGLVDWNDEFGIVPMLASSWQFDTSKTKVTMKLKDNITFSDSTKFDANNVIFHFNRLRKSNYYKSHFSNIKKLVKVNEFTITFFLKAPSSQFISLLASSPARIVKFKNKDIIGIGPFIPSIQKPDFVELKKNYNYWGLKPNVEKIIFRKMNDFEVIHSVKLGELDDTGLVFNSKKRVDFKEGSWLEKRIWSTWIIGFNQRNNSVKDEKVRACLFDAIKSEKFIHDLYPEQKIAYGLFSFGTPGFIQKFENKATKCPSFPRKKVNIVLQIPSEIENSKEIKKWIENAIFSQNKKIGFQINIVPFKKIISTYASTNSVAFLLGINQEYADTNFLVRSLKSNSGSNFLGINSVELDNLIKNSENEQDSKIRSELHKKINTFLISQYSFIPLMHINHFFWHKSCVSGIKLSPISEGYFNYRNVRNTCERN